MCARVAASALLVLVCAVGPGALAQTPTPGPPTLTGAVTGGRGPGGHLEVRIDVEAPGGWQGLHLVEAALLIGGRERDRIRYDVEDARLTVGVQEIYTGTGAVASGAFLRVAGSDVVVTTGGGNLSFRLRADVLRAIPDGATFELSTTADRGGVVSIRRGFAEASGSEGLTWGTVVAAVAAALLAGGVAGNLVASRRRPPARLSVYGTIQRRLDAERTNAPR